MIAIAFHGMDGSKKPTVHNFDKKLLGGKGFTEFVQDILPESKDADQGIEVQKITALTGGNSYVAAACVPEPRPNCNQLSFMAYYIGAKNKELREPYYCVGPTVWVWDTDRSLEDVIDEIDRLHEAMYAAYGMLALPCKGRLFLQVVGETAEEYRLSPISLAFAFSALLQAHGKHSSWEDCLVR